MASGPAETGQVILSVKRKMPATRWFVAGVIAATAIAVYWLTAYRTITWWSSSQLALAASDLGVTAPPGSMIPTILGWIVMGLFPHAVVLNLFAGLCAALLVAGVLLVGYRLEWVSGARSGRSARGHMSWLTLVSTGGAALALGLGEPIWEYGLHYNEYIITAAFTLLILWGTFRWWEAAPRTGGNGWLFLTALLFGLDISVHRTNALLLPALMIWVLLWRPSVVRSWRAWLAGAGGLLLGLAFHLLLIPMAAADPFLNVWEPDTFQRWWEYVSLKMFGGGFLVSVYPRNADFWRVQVMDWVETFTRTFAAPGGPLGVLGSIPLLLGAWGLIVSFRRSVRLGVGLLAVFLIASLGAIAYFNIPEGYFRSLYRHYFPSLVTFGVMVVIGAAASMRTARQLAGVPGKVVPVAITLLVLLVPLNSLLRNYERLDASDDYFAYDYAANLLMPLAPGAILLTQGDNDTFPLWYLQRVEGMRPDVTVMNIPLTNTGWFIRQQMRWDRDLPLDFTEEELATFSPVPWSDSTVAIPVEGEATEFGLPDGVIVPDTVRIAVKPTVADQYLLGQDRVLLRMLEKNKWRRPLYVVSGLAQGTFPWLRPYLRWEGLTSRIMPVVEPPLDTAILARILFEEYVYSGFVQKPDLIEQATSAYIQQMAAVHAMLATAYWQVGDTAGSRRVCAQMFERLSLDQWLPDAPMVKDLQLRCEGKAADSRSDHGD